MGQNADVVVVGAGPAGYAAAIRCAQLGFSVTCVDKSQDAGGQPVLGGTCLNWGCIPSKALLDISHKYSELHKLDEMGIATGDSSIDIDQVLKYKDSVVNQLTQGIGVLFEGNGVEYVPGAGKLLSGKRVSVTSHDGEEDEIQAQHVILAPGSIPIDIPAARLDYENVVDSTGALEFDEVPERLGVIGAGIVGLELGSVWKRFGSEVVLLEALEDFLPAADRRIARDALRIFGKQGLDIRLGARVTQTVVEGGTVKVSYQLHGEDNVLECDKLIVAVGRSPYTEGLLAEDSGVNLDERGYLFVNDLCSTGVPDIYAIGDVVRGPMLAHKGMEEGVMVAERIAGQKPVVNYDTIPSVIYTLPEIAWVGSSEQELKAAGEDVSAGMFSFGANGRAIAANERDGFVKVVADAETDRILGLHCLGAQASELIAQGVIAMEFGGTAEDLALTMFAHPSLSEAVHEAALSVSGRAIHALARRSAK